MVPDREMRQAQPACDRLVAQPLADQRQDLPLPRRQGHGCARLLGLTESQSRTGLKAGAGRKVRLEGLHRQGQISKIDLDLDLQPQAASQDGARLGRITASRRRGAATTCAGAPGAVWARIWRWVRTSACASQPGRINAPFIGARGRAPSARRGRGAGTAVRRARASMESVQNYERNNGDGSRRGPKRAQGLQPRAQPAVLSGPPLRLNVVRRLPRDGGAHGRTADGGVRPPAPRR